jgi:hypothetical protein
MNISKGVEIIEVCPGRLKHNYKGEVIDGGITHSVERNIESIKHSTKQSFKQYIK